MTRPISEYREALELLADSGASYREGEAALSAALDELQQARAQVQVLREALRNHGVHISQLCRLHEHAEPDATGCTCGLAAALSSTGGSNG